MFFENRSDNSSLISFSFHAVIACMSALDAACLMKHLFFSSSCCQLENPVIVKCASLLWGNACNSNRMLPPRTLKIQVTVCHCTMSTGNRTAWRCTSLEHTSAALAVQVFHEIILSHHRRLKGFHCRCNSQDLFARSIF